jgi:hypothetical protein
MFSASLRWHQRNTELLWYFCSSWNEWLDFYIKPNRNHSCYRAWFCTIRLDHQSGSPESHTELPTDLQQFPLLCLHISNCWIASVYCRVGNFSALVMTIFGKGSYWTFVILSYKSAFRCSFVCVCSDNFLSSCWFAWLLACLIACLAGLSNYIILTWIKFWNTYKCPWLGWSNGPKVSIIEREIVHGRTHAQTNDRINSFPKQIL